MCRPRSSSRPVNRVTSTRKQARLSTVSPLDCTASERPRAQPERGASARAMHPSEPTTAGHLLAATTSGAGSRPTRRVRSACKCCLIVSIISLMTSTQLSCQTAAQGLSPPPTASVTTSRESPPRRPCNQQRHEEVDAESRFDYEIPLPAALQNQRHFRHQAEAQRQQWARGSHGSQMSVEGRRRQRQFSQQAALLVAGPAAADGSQPPTASSSQQPEEFSLAAPASSMVVDLATGASNQQSIVALADGSNLTSGSGYALPDAPPPSTTTASTVPTFAAPTAGLARENRSSSEPSPSPATSNAEQAPPTSTTPTLSGDTISSPVAPQPLATTSASAPPAPNGRQQQQQTRQQARRMDEISNSAAERHSSSPPAGAEADQQPTATTTQSHSISSSPSSVSIITPLIAPSAKQQQSSSSMVKPIFVVGNPIGDLDYTSTSYSDQRMHSNNNNNNSGKQQQRTEKRADALDTAQQQPTSGGHLAEANTTEAQNSLGDGERMNGPALVYSGGHLVGVSQQSADVDHSLAASGNNASTAHLQQPVPTTTTTATSDQAQPQAHPPSPRLLQGNGAPAVMGNPPRRPSLPPPVNQANAASGFRSPMSPSGPLIGQPATGQQSAAGSSSALQPSVNGQLPAQTMPNFYQTSPPYAGGASQLFAPPASQQQLPLGSSAGQQLSNKQAFILAQQQAASMPTQFQLLQQQALQPPQASVTSQPPPPQVITGGAQNGTGATAAAQGYHSRRPLNITRVEHISAECSNDLIRAVIVFNGTFKGIIYSSGYVNDPTCLYVNGTGLARYEFSIRLNQCGTLGRQELHQPSIPGEARRRDQVMWNTLSIQYNPVIEQEWDEHFRVSCEYGSDFWKTISFSPFNVETNTGAPVVFTINPPQCQMDVLLGHGMGPKIAVDGPVTVGDPLTLLIHMKSEKAGYDILVKNCVAHNGGKQRMQLIDSNGCVVNERFISPFRGTYNDNDLRHVTLYAYLKAFRFTGSPVLYLECEIHMCQSACPPQMCYWRRLSKRSVDNSDFEYTDERATGAADEPYANSTREPVISDSLSLFKALQVRQEPLEPERARQRAQQLQEIYAEDEEAQLVCYRHAEVVIFLATVGALLLLVLSIAITCFMRIRMLTRDKSQHFVHKRLHPASQSLSPSLLSIGDAISTAGSVLGHQMGDSNSLVSSLSRHSMMKPDSACWQQQTAAGNSRAAYPASSNQFSAHRNRSSIHGCNR